MTVGPVIVDLSHKLERNMTTYPGDPAFDCTSHLSIDEHGFNVRSMNIGSHTGTHVDAPYHFFANGKKIDEIPLSTFIGKALIVDLTAKGAREPIAWEDLAPYSSEMGDGIILLICTNWSDHWNTPQYFNHPFLTRDAAEQIISTGVRVVGVDTLSPDETRLDGKLGELGFCAHDVILGSGGVIAENLTNLRAVIKKDNITVSMVPLNIGGSDGSPVRAFATINTNP